MSDINFWLLFVYVNVLFLFIWRRWTRLEEEYFDEPMDGERYYCDKGFPDSVEPDEYGIIGELRDDKGNRYYAVIADKDEVDAEIKRLQEEEEDDEEFEEIDEDDD